jgi:hypothetical protein
MFFELAVALVEESYGFGKFLLFCPFSCFSQRAILASAVAGWFLRFREFGTFCEPAKLSREMLRLVPEFRRRSAQGAFGHGAEQVFQRFLVALRWRRKSCRALYMHLPQLSTFAASAHRFGADRALCHVSSVFAISGNAKYTFLRSVKSFTRIRACAGHRCCSGALYMADRNSWRNNSTLPLCGNAWSRAFDDFVVFSSSFGGVAVSASEGIPLRKRDKIEKRLARPVFLPSTAFAVRRFFFLLRDRPARFQISLFWRGWLLWRRRVVSDTRRKFVFASVCFFLFFLLRLCLRHCAFP